MGALAEVAAEIRKNWESEYVEDRIMAVTAYVVLLVGVVLCIVAPCAYVYGWLADPTGMAYGHVAVVLLITPFALVVRGRR